MGRERLALESPMEVYDPLDSVSLAVRMDGHL